MLKEFKAFAMRGNVLDMAVGIIIGAAFGKIITSLVNDIIMPPIGLLLGNVDFSNLVIRLSSPLTGGPVTIRYGAFINTVVDFIIVAFAIFLLIRQVNRFTAKKPEPAAAPTTRECPECLSVIPINAKRCAHCGVQVPVG